MSEIRKLLQKRKVELEDQLVGYSKLKHELDEVNKAIAGIDGPQCSGCSGGCDICRTGPYYR